MTVCVQFIYKLAFNNLVIFATSQIWYGHIIFTILKSRNIETHTHRHRHRQDSPTNGNRYESIIDSEGILTIILWISNEINAISSPLLSHGSIQPPIAEFSFDWIRQIEFKKLKKVNCGTHSL